MRFLICHVEQVRSSLLGIWFLGNYINVFQEVEDYDFVFTSC